MTKITGMRKYSHVSSYPFGCFLSQECVLLTFLYVALSMKLFIVINTLKLCLFINWTKVMEDLVVIKDFTGLFTKVKTATIFLSVCMLGSNMTTILITVAVV